MNKTQNTKTETVAKAMCSSYGPYCGIGCLIERCPVESFADNIIEAKYRPEKEVVQEVLQALYKKSFTPNDEGENTSYVPTYLDYRDIEEMAEEYGVEVSL